MLRSHADSRPLVAGARPAPVRSCGAMCGRRSCTGLFATEGRCETCGDYCSDCDAKGACTGCNRFHGLVNGTCQQCPDNCYSWCGARGRGTACGALEECSLGTPGSKPSMHAQPRMEPLVCAMQGSAAGPAVSTGRLAA